MDHAANFQGLVSVFVVKKSPRLFKIRNFESGNNCELKMDFGALLVLITLAILGVSLKTFYDNGKKALFIFPDIRVLIEIVFANRPP